MKPQILLVLGGTLILGCLTGCKKSTPNVVGLDLNAATAKLQESGLKVGSVAREYAGADKPRGCVLRQDPGPGVRLASGTAVDLVLEHSLIMPSIVGQDIEAAKQILENRGFSAVRIDRIYRGTKPLGTVLTQDPPANLRVEANILASVAIESYVVVPNFAGMPIQTAVNTINQLGLLMGEVTPKKAAGRAPGTVASQSQNLGAKVALGTSIDLGVVPEQSASSFSQRLLDLLQRQAERQLDKQVDKALGTSSPSPQVKSPAPPRATSSVPTQVPPPVVEDVRTQVVVPTLTSEIVQLNRARSIQPPK